MKSIYEEIAHVYLRLNGFFISPNYVVEGGRSNEIDLLAYRPHGTKEYVKGYGVLPIDNDFFTMIKKALMKNARKIDNIDIKEVYDMAAIVEVKGVKRPWSNKKRRERIIRYSLKLFGASHDDNLIQNLLEKGIVIDTYRKNLIILLMGFKLCGEHRIKYRKRYIEICVEKALDFIINRIHLLSKSKTKNKTLYPYTTFQLLILLDKIYNITEKLQHNSHNQGASHPRRPCQDPYAVGIFSAFFPRRGKPDSLLGGLGATTQYSRLAQEVCLDTGTYALSSTHYLCHDR